LSGEARFITVGDAKIRVFEHFPPSVESKPAVVFLHGYSFSIDDWERIGTLRKVAQHGFRVLAIDLPSGKASRSDRMRLHEISEYNPILEKVLSMVGIPIDKKLVIVGPSMGGGFALSFAIEHPDRMAGLVLIAPSLRQIAEDSIKTLNENVSVLLVWGERDDVFPLDEYARRIQELIPRSVLVILKNASHPAYLDRPEEFHKYLLNFLDKTSRAL
jgi:abhydrolase domain-containing protein 14